MKFILPIFFSVNILLAVIITIMFCDDFKSYEPKICQTKKCVHTGMLIIEKN